MSSKYAIAVIVVTMAILMSVLVRSPARADENYLEVEYATYSPDPIVAGQDVEFSVKLLDLTNVSEVYVTICTAVVCLDSLKLTKGADDVWKGTTGLVTTVEEYYFTVMVIYENASSLASQKTYFTPVAPPSTDLEYKSLEHAPATINVGDDIDVYIELNDTTDVESVILSVCLGEEVCFTPTPMTVQTNGTYHARVGPLDKAEEYKYNVTVEYASGHKAWTVDIKFTPKNESTNGDDGDDDGFIPAMGAVAVIAILAGLAVTRRTRRA
jgi:hypothetical protein